MIEQLLARFRGCASYEDGLRTLRLAKLTSQGPEETILMFPRDTLPTDVTGVPILVTNKKEKYQIPYENEYEFSFFINYINQNDESKQAVCTIKEYADKDQDFRVFMPDENEFVKSITSIEPRITTFQTLLANTYTLDSYASTFNNYNNITSNGFGWNDKSGSGNFTASISQGGDHILITLDNVNGLGDGMGIVVTNYFNTQNGLILSEIEKNVLKYNPFRTITKEKLRNIKLNIALDNKTYFAVLFVTPDGTYKKTFTTDSAYVTTLEAAGESVELISASTSLSEYDVTYSDLTRVSDSVMYNFTDIYFSYGPTQSDSSTLDIRVGEIQYEHYNGDKGDEVEIIGLIGNIAKIEGASALILSDVAYNMRVAGLQRFIDTAYKAGLRNLLNEEDISVSADTPINVKRLYLKIFASFVVPSQPIMQESMSLIIKTIDENGSVSVYNETTDTYYKMVVDFTLTLTDIDEDEVAILLLFANRYRPVPAIVEVNLLFDYDDGVVVSETATLTVTSAATLMSTSTFMSTLTLMSDGTDLVLNLPNNYP